jgi:DNA polymerase-3 subunit chi
MRVDFYQLSRDPVEAVVALLADKTLAAGKRLLVVAEDDARLEKVSGALWGRGAEGFLANGRAGGPHDARQPVLLSDTIAPANGAQFVALADGQWREADGFERVFMVFDDSTISAARTCWTMLGGREGVERRFWKQQDGRWIEAG